MSFAVAQEYEVKEPIFKGNVFIYEYGNPKDKSIVLIHGLGTIGAQDWQKLVPELSKDYHVVTFDLPGFGHSSKKNLKYSPENYAKFVDWVVDHYVTGRYVLVGHSLGGAIALYYAAIHPNQLEQLILVDAAGILNRLTFSKHIITHYKPTIWWPDIDLEQINQTLGFNLEQFERFPLAFELIVSTAFTRQKLLGADPLKIAGLALVLQDFSDTIEQVSTPTHIIWGENDPIAPLRTGQLLSSRMLNARLHVIEHAGHNPLQDSTKEFNQLVIRLISDGPLAKPKKQSLKSNSSWFSMADSEVQCKEQKDKIYSGQYKKIIINQCDNVLLKNISADYLEVINSTVNIMESKIEGQEVGMKVLNSIISATAVDITADTAIIVSNSKLDFAGVNINARKHAITVKADSTILFSVSHISSPNYTGSVHEVANLDVTSNRY